MFFTVLFMVLSSFTLYMVCRVENSVQLWLWLHPGYGESTWYLIQNKYIMYFHACILISIAFLMSFTTNIHLHEEPYKTWEHFKCVIIEWDSFAPSVWLKILPWFLRWLITLWSFIVTAIWKRNTDFDSVVLESEVQFNVRCITQWCTKLQST